MEKWRERGIIKEIFIALMDTDTKENGKITRQRDKESFIGLMDADTKENGKITKDKDKESNTSLMDLFYIKDNGLMTIIIEIF